MAAGTAMKGRLRKSHSMKMTAYIETGIDADKTRDGLGQEMLELCLSGWAESTCSPGRSGLTWRSMLGDAARQH